VPTIKTIEIGEGPERACSHCSGTGRVKAKSTKKYRFVVDVGRGPDGKRLQRTYTFDRRKDAEAELSRIGHTLRTGEFVDRSKVTVTEVIDSYLKKVAFQREENTKVSYRNALEPARDQLGHRQAQGITREDVERLRDWMLTRGRRRGGKPGTPLSARSVRLTLGRLSAAFELAIRDRLLAVNPVQHVELPKQVKQERGTWSADQVRTFLATAAEDRLHAAWRLTLYGMRRGEVCGLRWADVDLDARTLTVANTRPVVAWEVSEKGPKSSRGTRTLPLDEVLVTALRALRKRQIAERLAAGEAYEDSGYLVTDELGRPLHPDRYSRYEFHRIRELAGLPRITLHDGRHTANSLMAAAGVPPHIRAAWCGHTQAVNEATYTHARPEDLALAAAALSKINNAV
jgi:integrase